MKLLQKTIRSFLSMDRRARLIGLTTVAALMPMIPWGPRAWAQQSGNSGNALSVVRVRPNFYLIAGAGGNVGVQFGADGVVLVDSGSAGRSEDILAAVRKLTDQPIRYIINTSADPEHVGGNEVIADAGRSLFPLSDTISAGIVNEMTHGGAAQVLAHEKVLMRMTAPTGQPSPYPSIAWPSETYAQKRRYMYLNGEGIEALHQPAAHSDGDSFVFFRKSDVIAAGDIVDTTHFPVIDIGKGGGIQGELDALNKLVELAIPAVPLVWQEGGTLIMPGHGRLYDQTDAADYRDMVTIIRDVIQDMKQRGMSLDQVKAAGPTKGWNSLYGSDAAITARFVESIYAGIPGKN